MSAQKILVIDDDPAITALVESLLKSEGFIVSAVNSGFEGIEQVEINDFDLILLDQRMPGLDGMATFLAIQKIKNEIPVIFITGEQEPSMVTKVLDIGALDYIKKPFQPQELIARVRLQLKLRNLQNELKAANAKLQDLVEIDDLTGLYNMRSVYEKIQQEIERARRYKQGVAVIMMDMDHFKSVNDDHDHLFGSFVLAEVGKLLRTNMRQVDFAARYGGDEFLMCLAHIDFEGAKSFAERINKVIREHHFKQGRDEIDLTCSLGLAVIEAGKSQMDARSLVRIADRCLYEAKENGRDCVVSRVATDEIPVNPKKFRKEI